MRKNLPPRGGIQREAENPPVTDQTVKWAGREAGVKGFVHLTCSRCGRTKTTYWKDRREVYRCCDCGKETELGHMRKVYTNCDCGQSAYYLTNSEADVLKVPCVSCGKDVTVSWDAEKNCYE